MNMQKVEWDGLDHGFTPGTTSRPKRTANRRKSAVDWTIVAAWLVAFGYCAFVFWQAYAQGIVGFIGATFCGLSLACLAIATADTIGRHGRVLTRIQYGLAGLALLALGLNVLGVGR